MNLLDRFRRLPGTDKWLLIQAWVLLAVTRVGMWVLPYGWLRAGLKRWGRGGLAAGATRVPAERIAWAVRATAQYVPWAGTCLIRSLAGHALLQRRGYPAELRIGVMRGSNREFHAHAWVTVGDSVLVGEREAERFVPLRDGSIGDGRSNSGGPPSS